MLIDATECWTVVTTWRFVCVCDHVHVIARVHVSPCKLTATSLPLNVVHDLDVHRLQCSVFLFSRAGAGNGFFLDRLQAFSYFLFSLKDAEWVTYVPDSWKQVNLRFSRHIMLCGTADLQRFSHHSMMPLLLVSCPDIMFCFGTKISCLCMLCLIRIMLIVFSHW